MTTKKKVEQSLLLRDIVLALEAEVLCGEERLGEAVTDYAASDLLSDVLALAKDNYLLLTGLTSLQVVRTAELTGAAAVAFVRGKVPSQEAVGLARSHEIPLFITPLSMFEAVRRLVHCLEAGCPST